MLRLSYPTGTVLSNKITRNIIVLSFTDSPQKQLRRCPVIQIGRRHDDDGGLLYIWRQKQIPLGLRSESVRAQKCIGARQRWCRVIADNELPELRNVLETKHKVTCSLGYSIVSSVVHAIHFHCVQVSHKSFCLYLISTFGRSLSSVILVELVEHMT